MIISPLDYESLFLNTKRAHRQEYMEHRKKNYCNCTGECNCNNTGSTPVLHVSLTSPQVRPRSSSLPSPISATSSFSSPLPTWAHAAPARSDCQLLVPASGCVCSRRSAEKKSSASRSHWRDEITSHARSGTAASFLPDFLARLLVGQKTPWGMCTEPHSFSHDTNSGAAELRLRRSSLKGPLWNIWPDFWFFFLLLKKHNILPINPVIKVHTRSTINIIWFPYIYNNQWRDVHFTPRPLVTSYLVHRKWIHLIIPSIWHYCSRIHPESRLHNTSPS